MSKVLLLDPFAGISGDMFLGALVDLGVPFEELRAKLLAIPELSTVAAEAETVTRGPFRATRIRVTCPDEHEHRALSAIRAIIERADLDERVKVGATQTFTLLAEAEAKVHGTEVEAVHFHEVGALDAIFDIVGAHIALSYLDHPLVYTRAVALGSGSTRSAHGDIPLPAPATVELLNGYPAVFTGRAEELATPTGAAIIAATCRPMEPSAHMTIGPVGYGAGSRETDGMPNVLRVMLGEIHSRRGHVCVITTTIDDMNPEMYGYLMERLFEHGALDVYYDSVIMKKNRPGIEVTAITEERDATRIVEQLMEHTTTLGVRISREERVELPRRKATVHTQFGPIEVKIAERPAGGVSMSPEYESCRQAALSAGVRLADVYEAARAAWRERQEPS